MMNQIPTNLGKNLKVFGVRGVKLGCGWERIDTRGRGLSQMTIERSSAFSGIERCKLGLLTDAFLKPIIGYIILWLSRIFGLKKKTRL